MREERWRAFARKEAVRPRELMRSRIHSQRGWLYAQSIPGGVEEGAGGGSRRRSGSENGRSRRISERRRRPGFRTVDPDVAVEPGPELPVGARGLARRREDD